jgi:hypothetical protein
MDTQPTSTNSQTTPAADRTQRASGEDWPGSASRAGRNLAVILALGIVFLGVASLVKPDPRGAAASTNRAYVAPQQSSPTTVLTSLANQRHPQGWKLVGMLEAKNFLVLIHAAPEQARYSVFALDGRLLKGDMLADDVYREFPDLDLKSLRLDPPAGSEHQTQGPLMLAEPVHRDEH